MEGVKMLVCLRREWPCWDEWEAAAIYQQVVREWVKTTRHACCQPLWKCKRCSPWGCPYFSLEAWPTGLLQPGLYRRLLYFANLLLCSAAILKRSKRKRGVGREVTETSCKETDEQERRWGGGANYQLQHSLCWKGCWKWTDVLNSATWCSLQHSEGS